MGCSSSKSINAAAPQAKFHHNVPTTTKASEISVLHTGSLTEFKAPTCEVWQNTTLASLAHEAELEMELEVPVQSEMCPICMDKPCNAMLPCLHRGCNECLSRIAGGDHGVSRQCPVCRRKIKLGDVISFRTAINKLPDSDIRKGSNVMIVRDGLLQGLCGQVLAVEEGHCLVQCGWRAAAWLEPWEVVTVSCSTDGSGSQQMSTDMLSLAEPNTLHTGHMLAELALVVHILSVLRLRVCRAVNVAPDTRFTNMFLARALTKTGKIQTIFDSVLNGESSKNDDPLCLRDQIPILFGRLPREDRKVILGLHSLRDKSPLRDTAELVLLCLQLILRHINGLHQLAEVEHSRFRAGIEKASGRVAQRIYRMANGMWLMDTFTGLFNENASDPYSTAAFQKVKRIRELLQDKRSVTIAAVLAEDEDGMPPSSPAAF